MKTLKDLLIELKACYSAKEWAGNKTIEEVVRDVERGDWLLWLAQKIDLPLNKLTLAKAMCAKTVIHLMKDERSINAVNVAERFGLGECTNDELNDAAAASAAAYAAAYTAAADAYTASAAAYAAAADAYTASAADYAAAYAAADADADAYTASAADYAADAAADAADAAADAAGSDSAVAAKKENQNQTANICRGILGELIIERVNELLK